MIFIMISVYIYKRTISKSHQKLEIILAEISASDDKVKSAEFSGVIVVVKILGLFIGYGKYPHLLPPALFSASCLGSFCDFSMPTVSTVALPISLRSLYLGISPMTLAAR